MTETEASSHWIDGAKKALRAARTLCSDDNYELSLFHCHLAVEKALKANLLRAHKDEAPPPTHDLVSLAMKLKNTWGDNEKKMLAELTDYAITARYDDPAWAEREATKENCLQWIQKTEEFLSLLEI